MENTYIIAKHKILSYAICPEMIYPLEVHGFTDVRNVEYKGESIENICELVFLLIIEIFNKKDPVGSFLNTKYSLFVESV